MTEISTVARQIQQLEIYLNSLLSSLMRGELPVNLQPVTQIFDNAIASIPPVLNLPQDRFIELYNDLPHLFTAYAIDVTLSEDSYQRQTNDIIFHRFTRGNYWIIPIEAAPEKGWLVPNPLKGLSLDRMQSLAVSFDRDIIPNTSNRNCLLVAPALVQILPIVEPLAWKIVERGKLTNTQIPQPAATTMMLDSTATTTMLESLVEKLVKLNDRVLQIERSSAQTEVSKIITDRQEQLQSIVTKIVEQLATKQQEILSLTSQLVVSNDRSARLDRELAALKVQVGSIETAKNSSNLPTIESQEIRSLKIDLEKLKAEYQSQKDRRDKDTIEIVKLLVAKEIANFQPTSIDKLLETIDAEIVNSDSEPQSIEINDNIISPFARLYNTGKVEFLRSYMVSTASFKKNDEKIELIEDNIGLYWIVPFMDSLHYLVPKIDFPNDLKYFEGLTFLFDGTNESTNFRLFKPAILTITKASMPKQWKLEQKGYLDPKLATQ
jgi:hypothetical protein